MHLSPHFQLSEFTRSQTAESLSIDNRPNASAIEHLRDLCIHILEPLRSHINADKAPMERERPLVISSGYRCPLLNRAVGGAPSSHHLTGHAADIHLPDAEVGREWFDWMKQHLPCTQLIWEQPTADARPWIHVSYVKPPAHKRNP